MKLHDLVNSSNHLIGEFLLGSCKNILVVPVCFFVLCIIVCFIGSYVAPMCFAAWILDTYCEHPISGFVKTAVVIGGIVYYGCLTTVYEMIWNRISGQR